MDVTAAMRKREIPAVAWGANWMSSYQWMHLQLIANHLDTVVSWLSLVSGLLGTLSASLKETFTLISNE